MKAKIVIGWQPYLLKNQAYVNGDPKLGHTDKCLKAMWDIKMLLTSVSRSFDEDENRRIKVVINAYRPRTDIDPHNLVDAVSDAIEPGIHVDDKFFDVSANGFIDIDRARIEIEVIQDD